jgi:hypothetical protein
MTTRLDRIEALAHSELLEGLNLRDDLTVLIRVARAAARISQIPPGVVYDDDDLITALAPLLEKV